jgi:LysM repeat protein
MSQIYSVRRGDTLGEVARRFGTSVDAIAQANNIKNPDKIAAGAQLRIPDRFDAQQGQGSGQTHTVRRGDTLSKLAERHGTTVDAIAQANNIRNKDRISVGQQLRIPAGDSFSNRPTTRPTTRPEARPTPQAPTGTTRPEARPTPQAPTTQAPTGTNTQFRDTQTGRQFPSRDGVPLFNQNDPAWGAQDLGTGRNNNTIGSAGCAISASAMAVSALSGQTVTPAEMDRHLDRNGGYSGDAVNFGQTASAVRSNPPITATRQRNFSVSDIDRQLAQGRPVVIGVDYKNGRGTDHWMTVTGKNADGTYNVNDPAGGRAIRMAVRGGQLVSADAASNGSRGRPYRFDGNAVTFGGGTPVRPGQANGTAPQAQTPATTTPARTEAPARPTGAVAANGFRNVTPEDFRRGGTNSLAAIVVGTAEGNRTARGGFRGSFNGHTDPGNSAHNIGSFSVQGNKARQAGGDPRRADEIQLRELANVTPAYEQAARAAGLDPNNSLLLASYYDMQTQSPATATAFLRELPNLARQGVTVENITDARVRAFHNNGKTGGWHAPSQQHRVRPDAERRMRELVNALRAQGLAQ